MSTTEPRSTTGHPNMPASPDEWERDRLDLDAYLHRVGYVGPLESTEDVLSGLHRAHVMTIPFESLDVIMGRGISLAMNDIQDKLVRHRRGGYCYEHNLLFAAVLKTIGFDVRRLAARLAPDRPGRRTHMVLNVGLAGRSWLVDVGFGASMLEPIPLEDGVIVQQGDWTHGVQRRDARTWRFRSMDAGEWQDRYEFSDEPQRLVDYQLYNYYNSTHPASNFSSQISAIRSTPHTRYNLRGRMLRTILPDRIAEERVITESELPSLLRETFGIDLTPEEFALVRNPPGDRPVR